MAERAVCYGKETYMGYIYGLRSCAYECLGKAQMFAYGTVQHGMDGCWQMDANGGCKCYCQHATTDFQCDKQIVNDRYDLYKFQEGEQLVILCHKGNLG